MDVELLIDGKEPDPKLGIMRAYIEEGINQVTLIDLLTISDVEYKEEQLEEMIGKPVMLALLEPVDGSLQVSRFDGIIYELHEPNPYRVEKDRYLYRILIRPKVWKLNIGNNSRSFPDKSRTEVVKEILEEYKLVKGQHFDTFYFKEKVYPKLDQILQTELSDWMFIRRLMTEAGINFYFGAPKDGETEEMLRIVDNNVFFPDGWITKIPWNPSSGHEAGRRIKSFETQVRAVPESVKTTALLGDGLVNIYAAKESVKKGRGATFNHFSVGGQDERVAKQSAKVLKEGFEAKQVTYEGTSNHFLIRAGEKFSIDGPTTSKQKKVLMTSVRHYLRQEADAAFGNTGKMAYENAFIAVREKAEVRPDIPINVIDARNQSSRMTEEAAAMLTDSNALQSHTGSGSAEGHQQLLIAIEQLRAASNGFGVMLGKVIEDAKVSDGSEMTCRIENERFPKGLTIKVAAPWLSPGGGVTSLPREGMQVYFMLVQGEGGNHEGVMIGYRSSGEVPGLNPAKQTETPVLKAGPKPALDKPAEPVVEKTSIKPQNRQRNALTGEGGVCELAVIDGSDATVALTANNTITLSANADTNISSKNHMHIADVANQQFGELTTGVSGDCTESINGNHQFSLQGNQNAFVAGNISRTVNGNVDETVSGTKTGAVSGNLKNTVDGDATWSIVGNESKTISGDKTTSVSGNNTTAITGDDASEISGNKKTVISGDGTIETSGNQTINASGNTDMGCTDFTVTSNGKVAISATAKLELTCGAGSLSIDAAGNVAINGIKVDITGSAPVSINGAMVKLNS